MKAPTITVLMPVYNVEDYIHESINSVLNQTYPHFEFLIIDDGSTDSTAQLIKTFSDPRITLIEKPNNTGLIDCLNLGFSLAKGTYIARMDGDDISAFNRFEKQLKVLETQPEIKVCGCWLKAFGEKEEIIKHKEFHDEIVANLLLHCSMSMGAVMFERKALENYLFDEKKVHVEDYDFWSRIAWTSKFYNLQEVLYFYRVHKGQVSTIYKATQVQGDIGIKLFLFKKAGYNVYVFSDEMITKMLLLTNGITLTEFSLFHKWISELKKLNKKNRMFSQIELEKVLKTLKEKVLYAVYFSNNIAGINKKWRVKSLFKLHLNDLIWVIGKKQKEILKMLFR